MGAVLRDSSGSAKTALLFLTILADIIAAAIANPTLPRLVKELAPPGLSVAFVAIGLAFIIDFFQFLFAPIIVGVSDSVGRRPVILVSICVLIASNLLRAFAPDLVNLAFASVILGIFSGLYGAAMASVADYTPSSGRAARFGLLGSGLSVGYMLGPVLGGILGDIDVRAPFYAATALSFLNLILVATLLGETLPKSVRTKLTFRMRNPIDTIRFYRRSPTLGKLAVAYTSLQSTMAFVPVLIPVYFLERFGWSAGKVGLYIALMSLMSFAFQSTLPGLLAARLGAGATSTLTLAIGAIGFGLIGVSSTEAMLWLGALLMPVRNVATATITAMMSEEVPEYEQGLLQGSNGSLFGLARVGAQLALAGAFGAAGSAGGASGLLAAPFVITGALLGVAAAIVWGLRQPRITPQVEEQRRI